MGGGGGGNNGPTVQQQQLEKSQATTNANLNLQENEQRKTILNSMLGTRVFRGSALSRALRGDTPGTGGSAGAGPASPTQVNTGFILPAQGSLLDTSRANASGSTPSGGVGGSGAAAAGGASVGAGSGRSIGARGLIP